MTAISVQKQFSFISEDVTSLGKAASELLAFCGEVRVIVFIANMGAGKTTFVKAICCELGVVDSVSSPTFSIINEYRDRKDNGIYHFDFYRLKSSQEALETGCSDYFFSGNYCFIEWPEIAERLLPDEYIKVEIAVKNEQRTITAKVINRN